MSDIRINKFLSNNGIASRREADRLVEEGKVTINGIVAVSGQKVTERDEVCLDGKKVESLDRKVVLRYYKPIGVTVTEKDPHAKKTVAQEISYPVRVTYAGRLDKDSEGLLLLTNDGDLIDRMMRGANHHEKEYIVKVKEKITDVFVARMREGVYLKELEQKTRACEVESIGPYTFRIVLTQGLNRQIRRMVQTLGNEVVSLKRVRVMNILLGGLKPGEYEEISKEEQNELYRLAGLNE